MTSAIYMDYHATTPVDPRVVEIVSSVMMTEFGNASSVDHAFGQRASAIVEDARRKVSSLLGAHRGKVIFTSGATEALNIVIHHVVTDMRANGRQARIALMPTEHAAVIETCFRFQKSHGIELLFIAIDARGRLDLDSLRELLKGSVDLVCVMAANNEIGNIYPISEVAELCAKANTRFLCDASQAAGKIEMTFDDSEMDFLVISGHKMYGPKGVGALISRRTSLPNALFSGGKQEFEVRPGTLNVPAIAGIGEACRLRELEMCADELLIATKRDRLQNLLQERIDGLSINGDLNNRLAGNLHISIADVPNDAVISRVSDVLAISRGASCSSGIERPSHVLEALGLSTSQLEGSLRIGIGKFTTDEEIDQVALLLAEAIGQIRSRINDTEYQRV